MSIKKYVEANYTPQQKEMFEYLVNSYPSTMLEDAEGNDYNDGYLTLALLAYVLGDTRSYINNLDTQMSLEELVSKIKNTDLSYVGETLSYDGTITSIAIDDTHIYVGGETTRTIRKYLKSDLSYIGETPNYGGNIQSIAIDDMHIYAGGTTTRTVKKYLKSDLSEVGETPNYGGNIYAIVIDDTHIYAGGMTTRTVKKYLKSDLSEVGETPSYGGSIYSMAIDDTHIYAGGTTTQKVKKYLKSDLSEVGETPSYGGTIYSIAVDNTHIYVGGQTTQTVRKYLKSDLSYVGQSGSYGGGVQSITMDDNHIYVGGASTQKVRKYSKGDLSYIDETLNYGGNIYSIVIDGTHIYAGGYATRTVRKYIKTSNNRLQNKKLLLLLMDFINVDLTLFNKSGEDLLESLVDIKPLALSYYDIMKNAGTKKAITQLFRAYSAYANVEYEIEILEDLDASTVYIIANKLPSGLFEEEDYEDHYVLKKDTILYKLLSKIKPAGVIYTVVQKETIPNVVPPIITMCEMPPEIPPSDDYKVRVTITNNQNYPVSVYTKITVDNETIPRRPGTIHINGNSSAELVLTLNEGATSQINVELTTSAVLRNPVTTTVSENISSLAECIIGQTASPTVANIGCVTTPSSYGLSCTIKNEDNTNAIIKIVDNEGFIGDRIVGLIPNQMITYQLITGKSTPVGSYNFTITAEAMYKSPSEDVLVSGNAECAARTLVTASPTLMNVICQLDSRGNQNLIAMVKNNDDSDVSIRLNGSHRKTISAGDTANIIVTAGFTQNPYSYTLSLSAQAEGKDPSPTSAHSGLAFCPIPA